MNFLEKLAKIKARNRELENEISLPDTVGNKARYKELMIEYNSLRDAVALYDELEKTETEEKALHDMIGDTDDPEMRNLAEEEQKGLLSKKAKLLEEVKLSLLPKDPLDFKNIIMEIRAGTGGEEAALFAADLFRMYQRHVEGRGW